MKSKYTSICGICGKEINVGDEIRRWRGGWYHRSCTTDPLSRFAQSIREGRLVTLRELQHKPNVKFAYADPEYREILFAAEEEGRLSEIREAIWERMMKEYGEIRKKIRQKSSLKEEEGGTVYEARCPFCGEENWVLIPSSPTGGDGADDTCPHFEEVEGEELVFVFERKEG